MNVLDSKLALYIVKRLLLAVFTVFLIITITFFVMKAIPGGPFLSEKSPSPEVMAAMEAKYGLDKPILEQYFTYLKDLLHGDFGPSIKNRGRQVIDLIMEGFAVSAKNGLMAAGVAIVLGLVLGATAAVFHNKWVDKTIMVLSTAFVAMPSFVVATILLLIFCITLPIFPANGNVSGGLVLPVISLALYPMSYITRLTRSSMLDVLGQDYIRTARAKGVSNVKVIFKHSLKNAVTPVITYVGPMIAYILTGSLVVEKVFAVPGLGDFFYSSITNRDYPMVMGTTIFLATLMVIMTLLSDICYKIFDPRVDLS
ncbi:MAG: ABC transporter permease [Selenomonadales bacterium]|nr:ABC transporter permease [Selenomonadales bacterium]